MKTKSLKLVKTAILVVLVLVLVSCGKKRSDEQMLLQMLPQNVLQFELDGEQYTSTATELSIEKQQTDKTSDVAYCKVVCESNVIDRTLYLILYSEYENKQWDITGVQEYQNAEIRIKIPPVTLEEGRTQVENAGYTEIADVSDCSDLNNNLYRYQYNIYGDHENLTTEGTVWIEGCVLEYGIGSYTWQDNSQYDVNKNWKLTGTWLDSDSGSTIVVENNGEYLVLTYNRVQSDGLTFSSTGKIKPESVKKYNREYGRNGEYTISLSTVQASGYSENTFFTLYPDTAKGGNWYYAGMMKRIS